MKAEATRLKISDELWSKIEPLLPVPVNTHPRAGGKKRVPYRTGMNGLLFVIKTGCHRKSLDATGICSGSTAHLRFQEWRRDGVSLYNKS
jgi:transposase